MTTSKIRIKLGAIEVEYEGSESFLKEELPALLTAVSDLYQKSNALSKDNSFAASNDGADLGNGEQSSKYAKIEMTTNAISSKLQVKSGPELIMAAATKLAIVDNLNPFSRQNIIDEMKTATSHFKPNYVSNLTASLKGLLKESKLNEPAKNKYALTSTTEREMRSRIA